MEVDRSRRRFRRVEAAQNKDRSGPKRDSLQNAYRLSREKTEIRF